MPKNQPYGSASKALQPAPRIVPNEPASSVAEALSNAKQQVEKAK